MTKQYFADTYALIEIILGSRDYRRFRECVLITTKLNLMELYYYFLRDYDERAADKYLDLYSQLIYPINNGTIRSAMKFKLMHKKEQLSYVDCIGYALAAELDIKFLTGDSKFRNKENVEFVR